MLVHRFKANGMHAIVVQYYNAVVMAFDPVQEKIVRIHAALDHVASAAAALAELDHRLYISSPGGWHVAHLERE